MRSNYTNGKENHVRMELKYCEHCGGLWVREGGAGAYCEKCQAKMAELPATKKKSRNAALPVARPTVVVDESAFEITDGSEIEAAGGVA
jgi:hypothetical protein